MIHAAIYANTPPQAQNGATSGTADYATYDSRLSRKNMFMGMTPSQLIAVTASNTLPAHEGIAKPALLDSGAWAALMQRKTKKF